MGTGDGEESVYTMHFRNPLGWSFVSIIVPSPTGTPYHTSTFLPIEVYRRDLEGGLITQPFLGLSVPR